LFCLDSLNQDKIVRNSARSDNKTRLLLIIHVNEVGTPFAVNCFQTIQLIKGELMKIPKFNKIPATCIFAGLSILQSLPGQAMPSIYPTKEWQNVHLENQTTSSLVSDDQNLSTLWVLPPSAGTAQADGLYLPSASLQFCNQMTVLASASEKLTKRIADLTLEYENKQEEAKSSREVYLAAKAEAESFLATSAGARELDDISARQIIIEQRLNILYSDLEKCDKSCDQLRTEIKSLNSEKTTLILRRTSLTVTANAELQKYNRLKAKADALKNNFDTVGDDITVIKNKLFMARNDLFDLYKILSTLEGGYTDVVYDSNWNKNVQSIRNSNPSFNVNPIPTKGGVANAFLISSDGPNYLSSLPSVLDYTVMGNKPTQQIELYSFPDRLTATLRLSLVGACPMKFPDYFKVKTNPDGKISFGLSVSYSFPSVYRTKVTFKYNLNSIYRKVVESGSSGGFFSSKSWTNISEEKFTKEDFEVNWREEDPQNILPNDEKMKIEKEIKADLIQRALNYVATPDLSTLSPAASPAHGALVVAEGLNNVCGLSNVYCAIGSWALKGLDSIFGSSGSSASRFILQDVKITETWSRETVRYTPAITSFTSSK
jgi:hypothetical protein